MQDEPSPGEILTAVAKFLRDEVVRDTEPRTAFQARVAANALDLVRRQIEIAPAEEFAEAARLQALMGQDGSLSDLNTALAEALESGALDVATPEVSRHLLAVTLSKLAVDQPNYSGYRAAVADLADPSKKA
jgi:Domain of unknown function (DUF6285)